ncbi:MAG: substrate-binding domain-containing protein [Candidatus Rokubacteria bacterium]|nr:substrate-binding domain-containing protein [Deltaproteobacteria bacterium]MBI3077121.1 substrate-binding domain-containing protein [Deltaproteobacteria bacterium]MBI4611459.1 substrate-binding domain-containing protein [Candidatus Rokubacteria bacterium]
MKIRSFGAAAKIGFVLLLAQGVAAEAAEVKVIAGAAMSGVIGELGPQFERTTGHKLVIQYGLAPALKRQIEAGEAFDLVILSRAPMDDLTKQGKIAAGTRAEIAQVCMGVAVRAGAPKPDIGSVEAFKRALLNASSITYTADSTTGIHLAKVFERLGIAEPMKAKAKPQQVPLRTPQAVADGEAELGIALTNILLSVRGVEHVGLLPPELQNCLVFSAGVGAAAKQPDAAKALIKHLTAPAAAVVIKAKGMEPATP